MLPLKYGRIRDHNDSATLVVWRTKLAIWCVNENKVLGRFKRWTEVCYVH